MGPGGDGCAHCILGVDVWTIKGVLGLASEKTGARAQLTGDRYTVDKDREGC